MPLERLSSADRKRQIADAALRILAAQGARRLTAMEIARAVGITDAALFRHFRDKDAIVAAAIGRFEELLEGDIGVGEGGDPLDQLGAFFVRRVEKARAHPEIVALAFNDRLAEIAGPAGSVRVQRRVKRSIGFVRACLQQAQRKRLIASDVELELLVWMVFGALRGAAAGMPGGPKSSAPSKTWAQLRELLCRTSGGQRE